jgi:hypothetical protein
VLVTITALYAAAAEVVKNRFYSWTERDAARTA